ncbi:MAG: class II fructose-bisphosphatase [Thermomicrobiales bacterium]|nr:class II fructose-bisphosphatase [Thermomicrobiales bacterium]MCO5226565.1 class II fructose-bisphosphatase [Thermomicrobiales bacterium]
MTVNRNPDLTRNIAMELVRCTEAAALMSARWMGRGDKESGDQAAVDAMRKLLNSIDMDATVVIGEGDKDHAPMLYYGERLGTGIGPELDIAVDPVEGTRLLANGQPNATCVIAVAERGAFYHWQDIAYMEKIAVGPRAAGAIDIRKSPSENLHAVAAAKGMNVRDLTVVVLDRPRHDDLIREIREVGARIRMILDGDVAGAMMAAMHDTGIDMLMGIGGAPEAVITAAALKCIGGDMQTRLWLRNSDERRIVAERGIDVDKVFGLDDLVASDDIHVSVTGLTDGELLEGVKFTSRGAFTQSLVLRSMSGTVRRIETVHRTTKLDNLAEDVLQP